jgi:hypothetical protein
MATLKASGSSPVGIQAEQAEVVPYQTQGETAVSPSVLDTALPSLQNLASVNNQANKRALQEEARSTMDPLKQAADIQAFQLRQGYSLADSDPTKIEAAVAQITGTDMESDQAKAILDELSYLRTARDAKIGRKEAISLRAEATMKRLISANPLFEDTIRAGVQKALGFDPTGATMAANLDALAAADRPPAPDPFIENMRKLGFTEHQSELLRPQLVQNELTKIAQESRLAANMSTAEDIQTLGVTYTNSINTEVFKAAS